MSIDFLPLSSKAYKVVRVITAPTTTGWPNIQRKMLPRPSHILARGSVFDPCPAPPQASASGSGGEPFGEFV